MLGPEDTSVLTRQFPRNGTGEVLASCTVVRVTAVSEVLPDMGVSGRCSMREVSSPAIET